MNNIPARPQLNENDVERLQCLREIHILRILYIFRSTNYAEGVVF